MKLFLKVIGAGGDYYFETQSDHGKDNFAYVNITDHDKTV